MRILKLLLLAVVFTACKSTYKDLDNGLYADIQTNRGGIIVKLTPELTPLTVANFVSLAEGTNPKVSDSLKGKKYYDGIKFHRVVKDFMIQGGDPAGTGAGGPGYQFFDEFPRDSIGNLILKHNDAGILSMANLGPKTNGSQFFITHKETPWLDGKHTVFGKVVTGQGVVDSIAENDTIKKIKIVRKGRVAKRFDAPEVFTNELKNAEQREKERLQRLKEAKKRKAEQYAKDRKAFEAKMNISKARKTDSGLKILTLQKGKGKKVNTAVPTTVNYTIYTADGKLIQSTLNKAPFTCVIDQVSLIAGWKEGIKTMREGDKTRLFVPYYLGYGEQGLGPIPPKADLVFEIEVLKVGK